MDNQNARVNLRHRGRLFQVPIYLGKFLRSFVYMSDWKMLPMSAIIAALVCMVVRKTMFVNMEGTLKGAFAFSCVAIWNGFFNSIQCICRERPIVKREHRSGMHISSYIVAHLIYQALLCAAQAFIMVYISALCGVQFPHGGFMTFSFKLDMCITIFLVTFCADMLSLLVSAIAHSTTTAMTVMPFILIFQLVFSGGVFTLPEWAGSISQFTISNYGIRCIAAQADYNNLTLSTGWTTITKMENDPITINSTLGDIMKITKDPNGVLKSLRSKAINVVTNEIVEVAEGASPGANEMSVGEILDTMLSSETAMKYENVKMPITFTLKDIIDYIGRDAVQQRVQDSSSASMRAPKYEKSTANIALNWFIMGAYSLLYALVAMIFLEFIDKDKR